MKTIFMIQLGLMLSGFGFGQMIPTPSKAHLEAMDKVNFIAGNWAGSGWIQMGPEKHEFNQSEKVTIKVNGTIVQIDGLGIDAKDNKTVIHNAFAIITYSPETRQFGMQAFRGDGARVDAYLKPIAENSFEWGFKHPMAGNMRYTISVKNDVWTETGEMSQDGKQWFPFFGMTLQKVAPSGN
jgi:hypothetical protein